MALYESDHTRFMREWMAKNPEQTEEQKKGRALWWDKPQDLQTQRANASAKVAQPAYVYFSNNK